jgi:hypothetical protein
MALAEIGLPNQVRHELRCAGIAHEEPDCMPSWNTAPVMIRRELHLKCLDLHFSS